MYVDVRELPPTPSSIVPEKGIYTIAIAATLGFIALLSSLLRVYTHGRVTRSFAIDDVLALAAAVKANSSTQFLKLTDTSYVLSEHSSHLLAWCILGLK